MTDFEIVNLLTEPHIMQLIKDNKVEQVYADLFYWDDASDLTHYFKRLGINILDYFTDSIPEGCFSSGDYKESMLTIRKPIRRIEAGAFYGCKYINTLFIEEGVEQIDGASFQSCSGLKYISLPGSITRIGTDAFDGCKAVTEIKYNNTIEAWQAILKDGWDRFSTNLQVIECTDGICPAFPE